jgi:hypothetical protein
MAMSRLTIILPADHIRAPMDHILYCRRMRMGRQGLRVLRHLHPQIHPRLRLRCLLRTLMLTATTTPPAYRVVMDPFLVYQEPPSRLPVPRRITFRLVHHRCNTPFRQLSLLVHSHPQLVSGPVLQVIYSISALELLHLSAVAFWLSEIENTIERGIVTELI